MKKNVDDKILSIPPFVSTSWENVKALYVKDRILVVDLDDGEIIQVPGLSDTEIEEIFSFHAVFLENEAAYEEEEDEEERNNPFFNPREQSPFKFDLLTSEGLANSMQHNPAQSNLPELPPEVLEKVAGIARLVSPDEVEALAPGEPDCNCFYCQITRAIQKTAGVPPAKNAHEIEEEVSEEDLQFSQWLIQQVGDNLYQVCNKLDKNETYRVFLGDPVGCTCGQPNCEHIVAVLKS